MIKINSVLSHWGNIIEVDGDTMVGFNIYEDGTKSQMKKFTAHDEAGKEKIKQELAKNEAKKIELKSKIGPFLREILDGGRKFSVINDEVIMLAA